MGQRTTDTALISNKDKLLRLTLEGLDQKYPYGLYEWLKERDLEAYEGILVLEDKINNNFTVNGSLEELKAYLRAYWIAQMKAIMEFEQSRVI